MHRHKGITWAKVQSKLERQLKALKALGEMEASGGEPDVIAVDKSGTITFCDCSAESPTRRRSLCFDKKALDSRKANKPRGSGKVFTYHNGAESYYAARGFRGRLQV